VISEACAQELVKGVVDAQSASRESIMKVTHIVSMAAIPRSNGTNSTGRLGYRCVRIPLLGGLLFAAILAPPAQRARASSGDDRKAVAALDTEYQAAVKKNDASTMEHILADDFVLVTGSGKTYNKADVLADARRGDVYEKNDEEFQSIRVWGGTAVVTARLWEKYTSDGKSFEHKFWFSDTYVRTRAGWKYVFGQSSLPLPADAK
jgi:hypothetical protein